MLAAQAEGLSPDPQRTGKKTRSRRAVPPCTSFIPRAVRVHGGEALGLTGLPPADLKKMGAAGLVRVPVPRELHKMRQRTHNIVPWSTHTGTSNYTHI